MFGIPGFLTDSKSAEGRLVLNSIKKCASRVGKFKLVRPFGHLEASPRAVVFTIDRAFQPRSSDRANAAALEALMNCLIELNKIWLAFHPSTPTLYDTEVFYERTTLWDTIPCLYARGWGDCKSLAAARVAENYRDRIWCRSVFRFLPGKTATMFHILLMYADGTWEDPSKALGMEVAQESPDYGFGSCIRRPYPGAKLVDWL